MPITLPDRANPKSRLPYAKLAPLVAVFIYLLLLGWNVSALKADFASVAPTNVGDAYNPMEITRQTSR